MICNPPPRTYSQLVSKLDTLKGVADVAKIERIDRMLSERIIHVRADAETHEVRVKTKQKSVNDLRQQQELLTVLHQNAVIWRRFQMREPWTKCWTCGSQRLWNSTIEPKSCWKENRFYPIFKEVQSAAIQKIAVTDLNEQIGDLTRWQSKWV